jgi:CRP-like cAMP-binding protein
MSNVLVEKLSWHDGLSPAERVLLQQVAVKVREVGRDQDLVRDGQRVTESILLLDGMAARYKLLSGGRRQISAIHVAGDFVDLHGFLLKVLDHGVVALSSCTIATVPHELLKTITETSPHLTRMLWLSTLIDASIHREWIANTGRRAALERTAHLICELYTRLKAVGRVEEWSFRLALTQAGLGDALGLSLVHVNRVVQALRAEQLVTWEGRVVTILDWVRLSGLAEFDPTYLHLNAEPR